MLDWSGGRWKIAFKPGGRILTTEDFMVLWGDIDLRQHIITMARRRSRLPQLQEEYVQEAWFLISCAPAGYEPAAYKELADRAIFSAWVS